MQVGISLLFQGHKGMPDAEVYKHEVAMAVEAEAMGFDMVLAVEHHFFDYAMCPDNAQLLSYVAARTSKIKLMPAAFILPWNDPLRVVEKAILLDHLSNGRALIGFGRGLAKKEFDPFRVPFSESRARFDQAAEIILRGLETGIVQGDSQFYKQPPIEVRPRRAASFNDRVYMVGMSPQSIEMCGKLGLGSMKFSNAPWRDAAVDIKRHRDLYRQTQGREAPSVLIADVMICDSDIARAEKTAREYIAGYFVQVMDHYELLSDNFEKAGGAYPSYAEWAEKLRSSSNQKDAIDSYLEANLWGDPARILAKLEERRDLVGNFDLSVIVNYAGMSYETSSRSLRLFVDRVLPAIKDW